ncbi:MAG TPA: oxidoreductase [Verrucomicrobiales bacterium]|nr:oxidoreductase [Verrucomicrobiales bacterium]
MKPTPFSRRSFLRRSAAAAGVLAFPFVARRNVYGASSRLNLAAVGVGGKGAVDIQCCATENIVALCDVDQARAAGTHAKYPAARQFVDFRKMFDEAVDSFDAVIISTPDHTHAHPALLAMNAGKHIYLQKPLTHTVYEARLLANMARTKRVVTQMGNQGHCHPDSRRLVELIRAGVLGDVREVHVWTDRPIWPQGIHRPTEFTPVPDTLNWDLWLGPAPQRPYNKAYVPFNWRGWWDFGTGSIGDMGCHNMDLAFWSLQLRDPESVEVLDQDGMTADSPAKASVTEWVFPKLRVQNPLTGETRSRPKVSLTWYDGGRQPDPELAKVDKLPPNGCILIGRKDTLYVPMYWGRGSFLSGAKMEDFKEVPQTLPRYPGSEADNDLAHHQEWIQAVKGNGVALSNFDYAGPMTEAVLLGNVAQRVGKKIKWDAREMRIRNEKEANPLLTKEYRKGWELPLV